MGFNQIQELKEVLNTILSDVEDHTLDLIELANRVQKDTRFSTTKHNDIVDAIKDLMIKGDTVKQSTVALTMDGKSIVNVRLDVPYVSTVPKSQNEKVTKLPTGKVTMPVDKKQKSK